MRQLKKNKQTLYYALYKGEVPIYTKDENGNILTTDVNGEPVPVIESYKTGYDNAVAFEANISFDSGETSPAEYGLNVNDYNAIISADKGKFPFNEQTLIWHTSEVRYSEGEVVPESADYRIIAIKTSLNEERFVLKKQADDSGSVVPSV